MGLAAWGMEQPIFAQILKTGYVCYQFIHEIIPAEG
jgi:hypothetical protein